MALATKCPHCNTTFRVAHDQLKLRGGIVRCGACNEVFDGNAALVDPAPRTPVIIDLPDLVPPATSTAAAPVQADAASRDAAPYTGTTDALQHVADEGVADAAPIADVVPEPVHEPLQEPAPDAEPEPEPEPEPAPELAQEPDFDLDLNGDEAPAAPMPEPAPAFTAETTAALPALGQEHDDAFDLDFNIDVDHPAPVEAFQVDDDVPAQPDASPDVPAEPALDERRFDGRLEPTLEIPDEHLAAVALHDSFELDAYPHTHDSELHSADERGHTLDGGVWRNRDDAHHLGDEPPATAAPDTHPGHSLAGDDDEDDDIVTLSSAAATTLAPEPAAPATPVSAREPEEPGFVKRSRRKEQWGKASRIAMACALPLLLAGLAYQAVATFRNPLAAAVPALKPALVAGCALIGCKVELPSQLDALSIDQGELQTMADNIFSFATSLRNQSATAQSWPHIELILNDSTDKPVLRRVFAPRDYLPPSADAASGFLPRSEQPVKLYFELSRVKASGYHIAVFYP